MTEARVVVTHAGAGSLLTALECGGVVLAVPRLASLGEHVDDHQLELCEALEKAGLIRVAADRAAFDAALSTMMDVVVTLSLVPRARLIATVASAVVTLSSQRTRPRGNQ